MADYTPLPLPASGAWTPLPVAAEQTIISIQGGSAYATNHSSPSGKNGHLLLPGYGFTIKANAVWHLRSAGGESTVLRTADT